MAQISSNLPWDLMNPRLAAILNPILANPLFNGVFLSNVKLVSGNNTINHGLARKLQGWVVTRNNASATFYDGQDTNQRPDLTLILHASAPATITLYVF